MKFNEGDGTYYSNISSRNIRISQMSFGIIAVKKKIDFVQMLHVIFFSDQKDQFTEWYECAQDSRPSRQ